MFHKYSYSNIIYSINSKCNLPFGDTDIAHWATYIYILLICWLLIVEFQLFNRRRDRHIYAFKMMGQRDHFITFIKSSRPRDPSALHDCLVVARQYVLVLDVVRYKWFVFFFALEVYVYIVRSLNDMCLYPDVFGGTI